MGSYFATLQYDMGSYFATLQCNMGSYFASCLILSWPKIVKWRNSGIIEQFRSVHFAGTKACVAEVSQSKGSTTLKPLSCFHLSGYLRAESNLQLHCFCISTLRDWLKKLAPLCQPIRSNTKPIVSRSHVFPRSAPTTRACFEF